MELFTGLGNIYQLSSAKTRLITAENVYGEKGRGGMAELTADPQPEVHKLGSSGMAQTPVPANWDKSGKFGPVSRSHPIPPPR